MTHRWEATRRRLDHHLNLANTLTDDCPVAVNEDTANAPPDLSPGGATPYLTLDPWEVELGDRLAGYPDHPEVARIVYAGVSGEWLFGDADDNLICHVGVGATVQVCVDEAELVAGVQRHPASGEAGL